MKETSSRGRTVSHCKRLSLIAGTTGPVKQPAKQCGVNGEFGADLPFYRRQNSDGPSSWSLTIRFAMQKVELTNRLGFDDLTAPEWRPFIGNNQSTINRKPDRTVKPKSNNLRLLII